METILGVPIGTVINYSIPVVITLFTAALHSSGTTMPILSAFLTALGIQQAGTTPATPATPSTPATPVTPATDPFAGLPGLSGHPVLNLLATLFGQSQTKAAAATTATTTPTPTPAISGAMIADFIAQLGPEIKQAVASSLSSPSTTATK